MTNNLTLNEILTGYQQEFEKDSDFNELNLRERQLMLPGIKHKYVAYMIRHKQKKYELEKAKRDVIDSLTNNYDGPVGLSHTAIENKIKSKPPIRRIDDMIKEQDIIIDYLEKVEYITKSMTYDMSNIIKIMELETT
jgi:hypothetical protein